MYLPNLRTEGVSDAYRASKSNCENSSPIMNWRRQFGVEKKTLFEKENAIELFKKRQCGLAKKDTIDSSSA